MRFFQTDGYLRSSNIIPVPAYDTAGSAKLVVEGNLRDTAAVASTRAAKVHGLQVLEYGIEDDTNNFTRFLILGRQPCSVPQGTEAKTSIVFGDAPPLGVVGLVCAMLGVPRCASAIRQMRIRADV